MLDIVVPYALERWKATDTPSSIPNDMARFQELSALHAGICESLQKLESKLNGTTTEAITSSDLLDLFEKWNDLAGDISFDEDQESCTS